MKGGTIIVGGDTGAFTGFMMQRGRMVICGNAGKNLGDSMYDGTIYIGGEPASLGVDAVWGEMTDLDRDGSTRKLKNVRPVPKAASAFPQDRRRQAAVELRQSRADREETGSVEREGWEMSKSKNGKGSAKVPGRGEALHPRQEPDFHARGHQRHPCEVGARPLSHARLFDVQEIPHWDDLTSCPAR